MRGVCARRPFESSLPLCEPSSPPLHPYGDSPAFAHPSQPLPALTHPPSPVFQLWRRRPVLLPCRRAARASGSTWRRRRRRRRRSRPLPEPGTRSIPPPASGASGGRGATLPRGHFRGRREAGRHFKSRMREDVHSSMWLDQDKIAAWLLARVNAEKERRKAAKRDASGTKRAAPRKNGGGSGSDSDGGSSSECSDG